jgi:hypothetical protein
VAAWRWRGRLALADSLPIGLPIAAIAGWWYARNLVAFHRPLPPLTPIGVGPNQLRTAAQARTFVTQSVRALFSPERSQGSPLTLPVAGRALIALVAVALAALLLASVVLSARSWARWDASRRTAIAAYGLAAIGAVLFSIGNSLLVVLQPQGRYLLVAAIGPLLAVVWAIGRLARDRARVAAISCACAIAAVALSVMGLATAMAGTG